MKKTFGQSLKLLYTDTDSFLYEIKAPIKSVEQSLFKSSHMFDFSNYPKDHKLFSLRNKKVPGFFKDETAGKPIGEFVGLRSKMYSFNFCEGSEEHKTAKGVKKSVISREIKHKDFKKCLMQGIQLEHQYCNISSKSHKVSTSRQKKLSLSPFDDKRYLLNNVFSYPYGHYRLEQLSSHTFK